MFKRKCDISSQSGRSRQVTFGLPAEYTLVRDHHQTKRVSHTHTCVLRVYTWDAIEHMYMEHMNAYDSCIRILRYPTHTQWKHKVSYVYVHEIDRAHVHGTYDPHMIRVLVLRDIYKIH